MNSVPSTMNDAADTICMISCVFTIAVCTERGFFLIISSSTGSTPRLNKISKIYLRINLFLAVFHFITPGFSGVFRGIK